MLDKSRIPRPTVKRLSLYLRELESHEERGQTTISSKQLGATLGLTDAQVRKDLAFFGQFGHPTSIMDWNFSGFSL
jgi:redox-sensing transcriptional repressor